ncbi:MAG: hypothetical protein LAN62_16730 [Acidobacteriia bacterium]|nr:hypothetical protein [Terriglobia bacterium]
MNNTRSFTLVRVAFLALLATVLSAGLLSAEDYRVTFTLPCEARWGEATLPPGDYSMIVDTASPYKVTVIRGENGRRFVLPMGINDHQFAGRSVLVLVRHGGQGTVRALRLTGPGLVFSYAPPKGESRLLAQAPELIQRIPVGASGK